MNVRVLYSGSIYDRNGLAKIVRTFADHANILKEESGHDIFVTDSKIVETKNVSTPNRSFIAFLKEQLHKHLNPKILNKYSQSYLGTKRHVEKRFWESRKTFINQYNALNYEDDAFIFHDIFTCWAYVNSCLNKHQTVRKFILVIHSNGEVFKMLLIRFPILKGKVYQHEMNARAELCLKYASFIIFVSNVSAQTFKKNHPEFANKVRVIWNGIPSNVICSEPIFDGKVRMITVGTVCSRKNQIAIIKSLKRIRNSIDASLTVVGGGTALNDCKQCAKSLNVEQWVNFLGPCDDVSGQLTKCNLFVMSSLDEGLPISAIEAMKAKLPLILTDVGGCRELINGNGFLIKPELNELSNAIIEFGKDVERQKEMSKVSYQLFQQKFTLEKMLESYGKLIKELLV